MIPDPHEQPTATPDEARHWYRMGRSAFYEAIHRGEVPSLKLGRRIVIPVAAARRQLGLDVEAPPAAEPGAPALSLIRATNEEWRRA